MKKEFIAVCGMSAVGKQTLLDKLDRDQGLRDRFGISEATFETFGPNDKLLAEIHRPDLRFVIWKWQVETHCLIDKLCEDYPESRHRIILVWRPWDDHWPDFVKKHDHKFGMRDVNKLRCRWNGYFKQTFQPLDTVELVNGSTPMYDTLDDWPT